MYTAHAGDARLIMFAEKLYQTDDHKPHVLQEKKRIEMYGYQVIDVMGVGRVEGQLAVSRAIGDKKYKNYGVIATPDTQILNI